MGIWWEVCGRVWLFENNVDTDQILPGYAMSAPRGILRKYAMAGSEQPEFAKMVKPGDVIVAGENFGCGSSREQAPVALKEAGVSLLVARSFARIFRRNCINIGLPALAADLLPCVRQGDEIKADIRKGTIYIAKTGSRIYGNKLSANVLETLECGGLINKVRRQLPQFRRNVGQKKTIQIIKDDYGACRLMPGCGADACCAKGRFGGGLPGLYPRGTRRYTQRIPHC